MTTFLDGPAKGQHLSLQRAPQYLRVVEAHGKWDALDQPEDTPHPQETVFAYICDGERGWCHVRRSGGRGGFYAIAQYRFLDKQPSDAVMRNTGAWQQWVEKHDLR